jgi:hypothetical protein
LRGLFLVLNLLITKKSSNDYKYIHIEKETVEKLITGYFIKKKVKKYGTQRI